MRTCCSTSAKKRSDCTQRTCASTWKTCPRSVSSGGTVAEGAPREDIALCLNAGSSSLKFALFRVTARTEDSLAVGAIEHLGLPSARATLTIGERRVDRACAHADAADALNAAFQLLDEQRAPAATLVGHRVVHGG